MTTQREITILRKNVSIIRSKGGFDLLTLDFVIEGKEHLGIRVVQHPISAGLQDKMLLAAIMTKAKAETQRVLQAEVDAQTAKREVFEGKDRWTISVGLNGGE